MTTAICDAQLGGNAVAQPTSRRHRGVLGHFGVLFAVGAVAGLRGDWENAVVLGITSGAVRGAARRLLGVASVLLYVVAYPPFSWPTIWFCLSPLVWIWRRQEGSRLLGWHVVEAVAIGFAMAWLATGFLRDAVPASGGMLHGAACLAFSLHVVGLAVAIRLMRNRSVVIAAALTAVVGVAGEMLSAAVANGDVWSVTTISLPAGATPLGQWSAVITPFGVSGIVYFINFLSVTNETTVWRRRWAGPMLGVTLAGCTLASGSWLESRTRVESLSFSVRLVQPHLRRAADSPWQPWMELDRLTQSSLQQDGAVDLVVWPECCLADSQHEEPIDALTDFSTRLTVQGFARSLQPLYRTNCLVGVPLWKRETTIRYGLPVIEGRRFNCGCLVSGPDEIACHEKLALVPFREGLPGWLDQDWIRRAILPALQLSAPFTPGREFHLLSFLDRSQHERVIAVSICYEAFFPWLPQYRTAKPVDAIIHLVYDGNSVDHPGALQRQILACRCRAMETRTWNLVCSTWSGSALIDPTGKVVRQLPATAGVLRSDIRDNSEAGQSAQRQ